MNSGVSKRRPLKDDVRRFLLRAIANGSNDAVGEAARVFAISRQAVNRHLRHLTADGVLEASGATRGRHYRIRERVVVERYPIGPALKEHEVWERFVRPQLVGASEGVRRICQYGCTEMINNAIEHSGGAEVVVQVTVAPTTVELLIRDDGVGVFRKIRGAFGLDDEQHAVLELSKGKLTTDPQHHTGEGIFFTSRVFDDFSLLSGGLLLHHSPAGKDWLLETGKPSAGTVVEMRIAPDSARSLKEVFDAFSSAARPYSFSVTHLPVSLATVGAENLVSRSQARRLVARLDLFDEVVLDFTGVPEVGQAFADEVFRVFAAEHPALRIGWVGANGAVEAMIQRALETKRSQGTVP